MKSKSNPDWEWERKPKKVEKGTNKAGKHRKSIYNMLSEYEEDEYSDSDYGSDDGDVKHYNGNFHYDKKRR